MIGGGPTGVELAGTLAEISRQVLANEFRSIDPKRTGIFLLEGGPRILPAYPEDLSRSAEEQLRHLGVQVRTSALVTRVEAGSGADRRNPAAGGRNPVGGRRRRIAAGQKAGSAGGSCRASAGEPRPQPSRAPGSIRNWRSGCTEGRAWQLASGSFAGRDTGGQSDRAKTSRGICGRTAKELPLLDKGTLATIGRAAAVAEFGKIHVSGFLAWLAWLFVHIFFLIGFRNRVIVLIQWAWSYFTYERGARLITGGTHLPGWDEMLRRKNKLEPRRTQHRR